MPTLSDCGVKMFVIKGISPNRRMFAKCDSCGRMIPVRMASDYITVNAGFVKDGEMPQEAIHKCASGCLNNEIATKS
jgi:hypothetical protein